MPRKKEPMCPRCKVREKEAGQGYCKECRRKSGAGKPVKKSVGPEDAEQGEPAPLRAQGVVKVVAVPGRLPSLVETDEEEAEVAAWPVVGELLVGEPAALKETKRGYTPGFSRMEAKESKAAKKFAFYGPEGPNSQSLAAQVERGREPKPTRAEQGVAGWCEVHRQTMARCTATGKDGTRCRAGR